jgi:hypothetical protein
VYRSEAPAEPAVPAVAAAIPVQRAATPEASRGAAITLIEAGAGLAAIPIALTVIVLAAPFMWMLAHRSASNP